MLRRNLTAKILVAVGVTVAVVIAIYTYFVIRVQSAWWHERTQAQALITTSLVHEYLSGVMLSDRHEEVQGFLEKLKASDEIWRGRLIRPDGSVVFSTDTQEVRQAVMTVPAELFTDNAVLQGTRVEDGQRVSVVMRPVMNSVSCQRCHDAKAAVIGAIIVEKSFAPAEASVAGNRNLLIVYGVVIFLLVGIVLWLLIVRLVTQPVGSVLRQMGRVQAGNLKARAAAETSDEIGELAKGFNAMVESLERTTRELEESHDKQIQQAGKLASIGELASGIAHEIRNPLAGISAAAEVLAEENDLNGQRPEIVGEIRRQITRLNGTLRDLLDFARQREPEIASCHVTDLIKPMLALVRPDAQKQRIAIVEQCAAELPPIRADAGQVQQALLNLFLNGIQAMPDGGTLTVGAVQAGDHVRLTVSDTGVGIARDNLHKIFSPFFTTKHRGTGLGLAITRTIVEKHRGTITVVSECGRGTTFTLEFAACQSSEQGAPLEVSSHGTN
ncbi:MAG TPA: ATP-binding protein [Verrucomicrobiae bacterium]|nr:ATP-binding protein [Verrucomicrobiae bacterium]